ncbi:K02A2.6-like [Cordylochernes scorpioides]|uniref:K02A2.6-like n=1 Tax=Cordylochernes scorpioides TaxID=51811 RepID=A0ABY6LAU8_9ARAC|nr:K02A2.6-like [Cordylochernes scorpioides]
MGKKFARMCGTSLKTINNIIHKDLELDTRRKGKVHKLTPFHMKNRATNARKLYEEHLAGSRSEYTATLDEAWMYVTYCNGIRKICYIKRGNQVPDNWVHQCSETFPKGFMVVGVMTGRGVLPLIKVPSKVKVNSEFYIECVLKPVIEQLKDLYPGEMDKVFLHHDKASSHTSNKTQQFLQEMKDTLGLNFIRNSDIPVKSPDASPLDFYGFVDGCKINKINILFPAVSMFPRGTPEHHRNTGGDADPTIKNEATLRRSRRLRGQPPMRSFSASPTRRAIVNQDDATPCNNIFFCQPPPPSLEVFGGYSDEDPSEWLEEIELLARQQRWPDDVMLAYARSYMDGPAKKWAKLNSPHIFSAWSVFKKALLRDFRRADTAKFKLIIDLQNRIQQPNESTQRYAEDVLNLCNKVNPKMTTDDKLYYMKTGLNKYLSLIMMITPCSTVKDFLELARRIDQHLVDFEQRRSFRQNNRPTRPFPPRRNYNNQTDHSRGFDIPRFQKGSFANDRRPIASDSRPTFAPGNPWLLVIPKTKQLELLEQMHDHPTSGHMVEKYVSSCPECQFRKTPSQQPSGQLQPIPPASIPFERIGIDLLGRFPKSINGNRWIVVCTDYYSRHVETAALPRGTASEIADFFLKRIVLRHGAPKILISDRGSSFLSKLLTQVLKICNTIHKKTTSYHPQTNGQTERMNRTLTDMISMYIDEKHQNWDEILPFVTFAYNSSVQETTGYSPYFLIHGREPLTFLDSTFDWPEVPPKPGDFDDYISNLLTIVEESKKISMARTMARQDKSKQVYDKHRREVNFSPDDLVLIWTPIRKVGRADKLQKNYIGPFKIIRKTSPAAWIKVETKAILTIHSHIITRNYRISLTHNDNRNFVLHIRNVQVLDGGGYMCQINTQPMMSQVGYVEILDHGNFGKFLATIGAVKEPGCFCGGEIQDARHLLLECPIFRDFRENIFGRIGQLDEFVDKKEKYKNFDQFSLQSLVENWVSSGIHRWLWRRFYNGILRLVVKGSESTGTLTWRRRFHRRKNQEKAPRLAGSACHGRTAQQCRTGSQATKILACLHSSSPGDQDNEDAHRGGQGSPGVLHRRTVLLPEGHSKSRWRTNGYRPNDKSLAERLIREGLEVEGTLLKTFRKRSFRITIGNLPFFVKDAAVIDALSRYGRITSIAPKQLRVGEFDFTDGRREAFILLHDGITLDKLPTRFEVKINGEPWPAFLSYGIKCSRCNGQGHRRANCPQLHGRPTTARRASPPPSTGLPPSTAPGLPRQSSAAPSAPAPPSPALGPSGAQPDAQAVSPPSTAPRPTTPAPPASSVHVAAPAPPPEAPAPEHPAGPRSATTEPTPPARPDFTAPCGPLPAQGTLGPATHTPDVDMTTTEEPSAPSPAAVSTPPLPAPRPAGPIPPAPDEEEMTPIMREECMVIEIFKKLKHLTCLRPLYQSGIQPNDIKDAILFIDERESFMARLTPAMRGVLAEFLSAAIEPARGNHPDDSSDLASLRRRCLDS